MARSLAPSDKFKAPSDSQVQISIQQVKALSIKFSPKGSSVRQNQILMHRQISRCSDKFKAPSTNATCNKLDIEHKSSWSKNRRMIASIMYMPWWVIKIVCNDACESRRVRQTHQTWKTNWPTNADFLKKKSRSNHSWSGGTSKKMMWWCTGA